MNTTDLETASTSSELHLDDPNPLLIFNVFAAILVNVSELLSRSLAKESTTDSFDAQSASDLESLIYLLTEARDLQGEHTNLIGSVQARDKAMYPVGVESLWVSSDQYKDYQLIRNRSIELFIETAVKSAAVSVPKLQAPVKEAVRTGLEGTRRGLNTSFHATSFGEAAFALQQGLSSAALALQSMSSKGRRLTSRSS